jgi:hypothetical protein
MNTVLKSNRLSQYGRPLVVLGAIEFVASLAMVLLASTNDIAQFPTWFGIVDVVLAFTLILTMAVLKMAAGWQNDTRATQISYTVLTYLVPLTIAAIWFFREQLLLNTLLPGLAWRIYVLIEMLPSALTIFSREKA